MQLVQSVLITYHVNIIQSGSHLAVTESHFEFCTGVVQPGILLDPVVLLSILEMILEYLLEQTEVVVQTDTVSGKSQSSDGIQETCCQSSESTVTKRRFRLCLFDVCQILAVFLQDIAQLLIDT